LLSSGTVSCSCATPNFVIWFQGHTWKSMIHHLLCYFCYFRCIQECPGIHYIGFPLVCWWGFLEPALQKVSLCQIPGSKCRGQFTDSNSTHYRSFWLSDINQISWQPSLWSYFCLFLTCKIFQNKVCRPHSHSQTCFMPTKYLCCW
jgi:hypothetical protein